MRYLIVFLLLLLFPAGVFAGDAGTGVAVNLETVVIPGEPGNSGRYSYTGSSGGTFIWPPTDPIWATPKVTGSPKDYIPEIINEINPPPAVPSSIAPLPIVTPAPPVVSTHFIWKGYELWILLVVAAIALLLGFIWWKKRHGTRILRNRKTQTVN